MKNLFFGLAAMFLCSCGVKGNPLPPLEPPDIGRGKPTFQKATEPLKIKKRKAVEEEEDWKDDEGFEDKSK